MAITQSQLQAKAASVAKARISTKALKRKLSEKYAGVENVDTVAVIGNGLVSNNGTYSTATFTAEIGSAVDVVNVGRLASAVYAPSGSQTGVGTARSSGTSTGTSSPVVSDVYLRADGTRQLEGNLAVVNGVTIDGVDISVHAANPDAHHTKLHSITDVLHHSVVGAQYSVVGLSSENTLGVLATTYRGDLTANTILRSGPANELHLSKVVTPLITTATGADLSIQPATKTMTVTGAVISIDSGVTGGAILQGILDAETSYARAFVGHNAQWDSTGNVWNIDNVGATDASGLLFRNSAAAIDVIFHASTGTTPYTMNHAAFTAGAKFTLTSTGRLGVLNTTPTYEIDATGSIRATTSVITPLLTTITGDLTIDPAGVVLFPQSQTIKAVNFNSAFPISGFQINEKQVDNVGIGVSVLTIGEIQADSLAVKVFVADETRVDRGNQLWAKSFGILAADFTIPTAINGTATVTFEDSPALPGAIFSNGDWIMFQQIDRGTGLVIAYFWGTVSGYNPSGTADEQSWTYTHKVGSVSTVGSPIVLKKGRIAIDWGQSGQAVIALSTVDESGSPYIKLMRWTGVTGPYDTNTRTTLVAIGDLDSGVGNSYYSPSGDGIWIQPGLSTSRFLVADNSEFRLQGIDLHMFNASNDQTVELSSTDGSLKLGVDISASTTLDFNGTTGTLLIGNATVNNPNLYYDGASVHLRQGAATKIRLDTNGNSYFAGTMLIDTAGEIRQGTGTIGTNYTGLRIWNDTGIGRIAGYSNNVLQWYANTDGKLYAAGGLVGMDSTGLWLRMNATTSWATGNAIAFRSASNWGTIDAALLSKTVTTSRYLNLVIDPDTTPVGVEIIASPAAQRVNITHDLTVQGTVNAISGMSVNGVSVSLVGHNHNSQYLSLSGGTLTGTLTTRDIVFAADNTYDIGTSSNRVQDLYVVNLHVDTLVGTPEYSHSHIASDIISGTFDIARIPTTWAVALTLDADAGGTSNYIRWLTQSTTGKAWDLIGRAHDFATSSQQNDFLLTFYDGSTTYVVFQADNATRIVDFVQTPTVGGTTVSLSSHNHDATYVPLSRTVTAGSGMTGGGALTANITISHADTSTQDSVANTGLNFIQSVTLDTYGHVTALTSSDIGTALDARYVNVTGDTMTGALGIAMFGANLLLNNTSTAQYSSPALILRNDVQDGDGDWYIFAEKASAGASTGAATFQVRKRNAAATIAITPILINATNDIVLNAGYNTGGGTYGNVGVKKTPSASYSLDVSGSINATTSVLTPSITTASGNLSITSVGGTVAITGALTGSSTAAFATSVSTPTVTHSSSLSITPSGDLTLDPAGNVLFPQAQTIKSVNFNGAVFPIAGFQINEKSTTGVSVLTIGEIQADSLAVKVFVADETRVDRGNQLWAKSFGIVAADFTVPSTVNGTVTVTFEDSPAITGALFSTGDWLMFQQIDRTSGLVIGYSWGTVSGYTSNPTNKEQSWTFTFKSGANSVVIRKGRLAIDWGQTGQGIIALSTVDASGSPYIKLMRWDGVTGPYDTNTRKTIVAIGDLSSGVGNSFYPSPSGDGIWIQPGLSQTRFLVADDNDFRLQGINLRMYNSSNQTVDLSATNGSLKLGINIASSATTGFTFDGATGNVTIGNASYASTVTVYGQIVVKAGSSGYSNLTDKPTSLSGINSTEGTKLSGIEDNATEGATWGTNLNSVPTRFGDAPSGAGLYVTPTHLGYFNGSAWKAWISSAGGFYFGGSTGAHLEWNGTKLRGLGTDGTTEQWYADSTDGKLYAGAGAIALDSLGIHVANSASSNGLTLYRVNTFTNTYKAGRLWALSDLSPHVYFSAGRSTSDGDASDVAGVMTLTAFGSSASVVLNGTSGKAIISATTVEINGTLDLNAGTITDIGSLSVTNNITVGGTVDGVDIGAFKSAYDSHNHNSQYLALSGGTVTGTITARDILFPADNTYDIGSSSNRVQDLYVVNLHVNSVVGTPAYAHSHAASDITSGVLDFARIPTTWTGALTLDADSAGTSNYVRWLTQTTTGKAWDLVGRAHDYATANQQNDLLLNYYDGTSFHTVFHADSVTKVIDFGQTPTVGGVSLSLSTHNHDGSYITSSRTVTAGGGLIGGGALSANITISHGDTSSVADVSNTNGNVLRSITFDTYGHVQTVTSYDLDGRYYTETEIASLLTGYVPTTRTVSAGTGLSGGGALSANITLSHGSTSSASSIANTGTTFIQSLTIDSYGHITAIGSTDVGTSLDARYVNVTGDTMTGGLTLGYSGAAVVVSNTATTQYSSAALILCNDAQDGDTNWYIFAEKASAGTSTGATTLQVRKRNASATVAITPISITATNDIILNAGYNTGGGTYGNVGIKKSPSASYALDVSGSINATTSVLTPSITTSSGSLTITSASTIVSVTGVLLGSSSATFASTLTAASDIDSNHTLGRAIVGYALATDTATFSHIDHNTSTNYGLAQSSAGRTVVNAATSQTVDLSIANATQWSVNTSAILPRGSAQVDIGDYNRLVRTLNAAELSVQTLVAKNVISTIGGDILVTPTTKLIADISSSAGGIGLSDLYTNITAFWRLEESSSTRYDAKGSNNLSDITSTGSITGKIGTAANFTGSNYLYASDSATLSVSDINFYVSCWIYIGNDTGTNRYILFKGTSTSASRAWALYLNGSVGAQRARFQVWNTGMGSNATVTASGFGTLAINTWYFVEAWHNASTNQIGVAVNRTENTTAWSNGVNDDTGPFYVGAAGATSNFTGYIDEVGFWKNYIPTITERNALYNSGSGITWSNIYLYGATDINLDVENNSLRVGEYVILKTAPAGIAQQEKMKITGGPSAISGGFRYTATRDLGVTGPKNWYSGNAVASQQKNIGEGYLWLTSTSTVYGHTGPSILGYVRTGANVDDVKPMFVKGNLRSLVDYATDEYGDAAGNDLTLSPATGYKGYAIDRTNGLRLFNADLTIYQSATKIIDVNATDGFNVQAYTTTPSDNFRKMNWWSDITTRSGDPVTSIYGQIIGSTWLTRIEAGHDATHSGTLTLLAENANGIDIASLSVAAGGTPTIDLIATAIALSGQVTITGDIDLNGNDIVDIGTIGDAWTGLSFGSGWANYGGGEGNGQHKKVGDLVFLRGLVYRFTGSSTTIATLPVGARPPAYSRFVQQTNTGVGQVDVHQNGSVVFASGGAGWVCLDRIVFSTI